jgi:predicted DNA-binding transcriptional regulator YafY
MVEIIIAAAVVLLVLVLARPAARQRSRTARAPRTASAEAAPPPAVPQVRAPTQPAAAASAPRRSKAQDEEDWDYGLRRLAEGLQVPARIEYVDAEGVFTERDIAILGIAGERPRNGDILAIVIYAFCHLRQDNRTFLLGRIRRLWLAPDALPIQDGDEIELWVRRSAGLETPFDSRRAEEAAAWEARDRRRSLVAGQEHAVIPQRVSITTERAREPGVEQTSEVFVIGFDTDTEGRATVLFVASRLDVKRGRAIYIAETRDDEKARLTRLIVPPGGDVVADVAAWVVALPRDPDRLLAKHR